MVDHLPLIRRSVEIVIRVDGQTMVEEALGTNMG